MQSERAPQFAANRKCCCPRSRRPVTDVIRLEKRNPCDICLRLQADNQLSEYPLSDLLVLAKILGALEFGKRDELLVMFVNIFEVWL